RLLAHRDIRVRQEAEFALVEQNAIVALNEVAYANENQLARLHAIWGLAQLARKSDSAVGALVSLLSDSDVEVRAQAAKVLGDVRITRAGPALIKVLADQTPRPRFFAAISLGKIAGPEAIGAVSDLLRAN